MFTGKPQTQHTQLTVGLIDMMRSELILVPSSPDNQRLSFYTVPLLSLEVQQPPSAPPHFSLRADTSRSSLSRRSRRAPKSASQPQDPGPEPEGEGTSLILWVRTRGEPGARSISLPVKKKDAPTDHREKSSIWLISNHNVTYIYLVDHHQMNPAGRHNPLRSPPARTYDGPQHYLYGCKYIN